MLFGDELWPAESALVRFQVAHRGRRWGRCPGWVTSAPCARGAMIRKEREAEILRLYHAER